MKWLVSIGVLFGKLWSWLRGGHGYRVTVEARPEAAIAADNKTREKLHEQLKAKRKAMVEKAVAAAHARAAGFIRYADELDAELQELQAEHDALAGKLDHQE